LTRKLEALDVVHALVIVELHDGIELLLLLSSNLVLAIPGGEGVHFVQDRIPLLLGDFWGTGSSHELGENDLRRASQRDLTRCRTRPVAYCLLHEGNQSLRSLAVRWNSHRMPVEADVNGSCCHLR
jgi:hypothetical protein